MLVSKLPGTPHRGRNSVVPGVSLHAPKRFQSLRYSSFGVVGRRLFNVLPVNIWNISGCTVETFKLHLDRFLGTVPDEPQVRLRPHNRTLFDVMSEAVKQWAK